MNVLAKAAKSSKDITGRKIASLRQQDKKYKESYLKWQMEHRDDIGFYLSDKAGEYTYRQGEGFINQNPEASESFVLDRVHTTIAISLISCLIMRIFCVIILPYAVIDMHIAADMTQMGYFSGNTLSSVVINYISQFARYLVPIIFVMLQIKIPRSLAFPTEIRNKPLFFESIPAVMVVYGISVVFSGGYYVILDKLNIETQIYVPLSDNRTVFMLNVLLITVIVPILNELLVRGIFMQMLKQFGDGYALIITAIISAFMEGSVRSVFIVFTCALLLGYFSLRTGSIITPIIMKIALSSLSFWIPYVKFTGLSTKNVYLLSYAIAAALLIIGGILTMLFVRKHSDKIALPISNIYMSTYSKAMDCVTNPAVVIFLALLFVYHAASGSLW